MKCLGLDESNKGRFPEIYVGAFSSKKEYALEKVDPTLPKRRKSVKISEITEDLEYRYVLIPEEYKKFLHPSEISIIAFAELINYFNPDFVMIDGELRQNQLKKLESLLSMKDNPSIISICPKADTSYKLVNKADHLANILHKEYNNRRQQDFSSKNYGEIISNLITPKIEVYKEKLAKFK